MVELRQPRSPRKHYSLTYLLLTNLVVCSLTIILCREDTPQYVLPTTSSAFDTVTKDWHNLAKANPKATITDKPRSPKPFTLEEWGKSGTMTQGGLHAKDRLKVAELYGKANSLFEWGLGESTSIASYMEVPRYAGVDSDPRYVATARDEAKKWFRFSYADIGDGGNWGRPNDKTQKKIYYNYVWAPLLAELEAFDVYMVDGRMRPICALAAFLHASKYNKYDSLVLMHDMYDPVFSKDCPDCHTDKGKARKDYHRIKEVADAVDHSGAEIFVFRRKKDVTDEQILSLYNELVVSKRVLK